eukprot:14861269-Alexandrium_andersonii.AAC.1
MPSPSTLGCSLPPRPPRNLPAERGARKAPARPAGAESRGGSGSHPNPCEAARKWEGRLSGCP